MLNFLIAVLAGLVCGVLSGFGIGGGSLLMVWMTAVLAMEQKAAQGINLLYFLPTAVCALIFHAKHRQICWKAVVPAALAGCAAALLARTRAPEGSALAALGAALRLHAAAGRQCATRFPRRGNGATELAEALPAAWEAAPSDDTLLFDQDTACFI